MDGKFSSQPTAESGQQPEGNKAAARITIIFPTNTDDPITLNIQSDGETYGPADILQIGASQLMDEMDDLNKCAFHAKRREVVDAQVRDQFNMPCVSCGWPQELKRPAPPAESERVSMSTEKATRNSEALNSFVSYCAANPFDRFWQALRNWSKFHFIYGSNTPLSDFIEDDAVNLHDTFNIEGMNGTRQSALLKPQGETPEGGGKGAICRHCGGEIEWDSPSRCWVHRNDSFRRATIAGCLTMASPVASLPPSEPIGESKDDEWWASNNGPAVALPGYWNKRYDKKHQRDEKAIESLAEPVSPQPQAIPLHHVPDAPATDRSSVFMEHYAESPLPQPEYKKLHERIELEEMRGYCEQMEEKIKTLQVDRDFWAQAAASINPESPLPVREAQEESRAIVGLADDLAEALYTVIAAIPKQTEDADWWQDDLSAAVREANKLLAEYTAFPDAPQLPVRPEDALLREALAFIWSSCESIAAAKITARKALGITPKMEAEQSAAFAEFWAKQFPEQSPAAPREEGRNAIQD